MPTGDELSSKIEETVDKAKEKAEEAIAAFKSEYMSQLEGEESKLKSIKAPALTLKDSRLTGLVEEMEEKLAAVREKLGELGPADEGKAASLQDEIERLMGEIPRLYEEGKARLDQLKGEGMPELPGGIGLPGGGEEPEK